MKKNYLFILPFCLLVLIDGASWLNIKWSLLGTTLWLLNYILIIFYALHALKKIILFSLLNKTYFTLFTLSLCAVAVMFLFLPNQLFSNEAASEIACQLKHWQSSIDFGYWQSCYLGYPARQFILPALLSKLLGANIYSLNLGFILNLFLGLIILASSLQGYITTDQLKKDLLIAVALLIPYQFYLFNYLVLAPEQSILPLCWGLILSGLSLRLLKSFHILEFILWLFIFYQLLFAYTTALAYLPVLMVLLYVFYRQKKIKLISLLLICSGLLIGLLTAQKIRNTSQLIGQLSLVDNGWQNFLQAFKFLLWPRVQFSMINPFFLPIFSIMLYWLCREKVQLTKILILWCLIVVFWSVNSMGHGFPSLPLSLHRSVIVLPLLMIYIGLQGDKLIKHAIHLKWIYLYVLVTTLLFTILNYPFGLYPNILRKQLEVNKMLSTINQSNLAVGMIDIDTNNFVSLVASFSYYNQSIKFDYQKACPQTSQNKIWLVNQTQVCFTQKQVQLLGVQEYQNSNYQLVKF